MEDYQKLVRELILQEVAEYVTWNTGASRADAFKHLYENGFENLFGNIDGSRTCSTYDAEQMLQNSGAMFDSDIQDLFNEIGDDYFGECLKRGAETLDVVICELLGSRELYDLAQAQGVEL